MANIIDLFKALTLEQQSALYPQLTAVLEASKEARRRELRAELSALDGKAKPSKPKFKGPNGEVWGGRGQMAAWLQKLKDAGEDINKYRVA